LQSGRIGPVATAPDQLTRQCDLTGTQQRLSMAHVEQVLPGMRVGHYELLSQVGAGGMGVVYKGFDTKLQRTVALKFLTSACSSHDRERLLQEARAASTLDHKNIANIHAVEENDDGQLFIVMAYYEGESLADRMRHLHFLPGETLTVIRQIAEGLEHAHLHTLVHRDIKPSNVILPLEGEAKIVDFGLAKFLSANAVTQSCGVAGTLSYMSPEQVQGGAVDARTDIWSLGVVAYQLLTNGLPFAGESPAEVIRGIVHRDPSMHAVPDEWQLILRRALAKNVRTRYHSCSELLTDLLAIQDFPGCTQPLETSPVIQHRIALLAAKPVSGRFLKLSQTRQILIWVLAFTAIATGGLGLRSWLWRSPQTAASGNRLAYQSYLQGVDLLARYDKPGNLDAAIQSFEKTTRTDPRFALGFAELGEAYWNKYRLDQDPKWIEAAMGACNRAAELNDQLPAIYITLGRIHDGTGKHELALQEFHRALDLDHRNADALLGLADSYASVGRVQEAEETYKRAADMRPESWNGLYRLGLFYFQQRRYQDAAEQLRKVVELTPDNAQAHSGLGITLAQLTLLDEAEAELKKSIEIQASYFAFSNLGIVYYQQRRWGDAAAMWNKALQLNRSDFRVWANLALAYDGWIRNRKPKMPIAKNCRGSSLWRSSSRTNPLSSVNWAGSIPGSICVPRPWRSSAPRSHVHPTIELLSCAGETYNTLGDHQQAVAYLAGALENGLPLIEVQQSPSLHKLLAEPKLQMAHADHGATPNRP